jgi:o-succinylbenzoate synthase
MLKALLYEHSLQFKVPAGTSRGVLTQKPGWIIKIFDSENPELFGLGECSVIPGLSADDLNHLLDKLKEVTGKIHDFSISYHESLVQWPSVRFAIETALSDLHSLGTCIHYSSDFTSGRKGIAINGLIWMGSPEEMKSQIDAKIEQGFRCLKMKIGAINFEDELRVLKYIRNYFPPDVIELRVDANGAFLPHDVESKLEQLAAFHIHSIEQPIRQRQWKEMAKICRNSPIPVALDEELIGIASADMKQQMLKFIQPQFIILKPGLLGGIEESTHWINLAEKSGIGWWITSALEGNIGLNVIAQWTFLQNNSMPQGLGTGQLFINNINSPLQIEKGYLCYNPQRNWNLEKFTC